ncbi:uncharacterized protein MYCGRDRAFT_96736 [Zymoseptoria tritici IPO323]|uniref:Uncharacterized protein n=1 Tax=Zymoseptoria tritici (strain CBS 115943 / IPO323) TaxID=336722 RepID=F9XNC2_ZYMTI|nr:uncharacterized protein MYCGRDRAFT_96736 [Zymoseptoria tritici IPO323]EGP83541.1 hypothetical protein MYCGRDRAFT_96736 [Zymoseptoria tritici IPO323]
MASEPSESGSVSTRTRAKNNQRAGVSPKPKKAKAKKARDEPKVKRHEAVASGSKAGAQLKKSKDAIEFPKDPLPPLKSGQLIRIGHPDELNAQLFTDDYDDIDERSYKKGAIPDLRQAPSRQLNNIIAREYEMRTSIALNHDYAPQPAIPRAPRATDYETIIGTPNKRWKFGKIGADLILPVQVNLYTDWLKARSDNPELVKDYFELQDIDGKSIPWAKQPPEKLAGKALEA